MYLPNQKMIFSEQSLFFVKSQRSFLDFRNLTIFFPGTVPRLSRVVLDVGITFMIYDSIMEAINHFWPDQKRH